MDSNMDSNISKNHNDKIKVLQTDRFALEIFMFYSVFTKMRTFEFILKVFSQNNFVDRKSLYYAWASLNDHVHTVQVSDRFAGTNVTWLGLIIFKMVKK